MILSNIVTKVDRCTPRLSHFCGYHATLGNLLEVPENNPKYKAALLWLNGTKGNLPFTSDDLPKKVPVPCNQPCVWGTCFEGKCVCYDGYTGVSCDKLDKKYLDCASNKTLFGMNTGGLSDWHSEVTFSDVHRRSRQWIVQKVVYPTDWAQWDQNDVNPDENGYPLYLQVNSSISRTAY